MNELADWFRIVNVMLAGGSLFVMVATLIRRWDLLSPRIQRIGLAFSMLLATTAYGSGEAMRQDVPFGARIVMATASLLAIFVSLTWRFDEDL